MVVAHWRSSSVVYAWGANPACHPSLDTSDDSNEFNFYLLRQNTIIRVVNALEGCFFGIGSCFFRKQGLVFGSRIAPKKKDDSKVTGEDTVGGVTGW